MCYVLFGETDVEMTVRIDQHTNCAVYYSIRRDEGTSSSGPDLELNESVTKKYTTPGTYEIIVENTDTTESASIDITTNVVKPNEVDNDNLAIKDLLLEIETELMKLRSLDMRIQATRGRQISDAERILRGLYGMVVIPFIFVFVSYARFRGVQSMFGPQKKGAKI